MEPTVTRETDPDRYQIAVEGKPAGFAQFVDKDGRRVFFHTEIDDVFGGQGLGGTLVGQALAATREEGQRIVAVCPFVVKYVQKHTEFEDILDKATPALLEAIPKS